MSSEFFSAAQSLADLLEQENDALKRCDFSFAVALLPAKDTVLADLARLPKVALPPMLAALMQRVGVLAAENQVLLERALAVQTSVVRIVAKACTPAPVATQYYEHGGRTPSQRAVALAVSTRA